MGAVEAWKGVRPRILATFGLLRLCLRGGGGPLPPLDRQIEQSSKSDPTTHQQLCTSDPTAALLHSGRALLHYIVTSLI